MNPGRQTQYWSWAYFHSLNAWKWKSWARWQSETKDQPQQEIIQSVLRRVPCPPPVSCEGGDSQGARLRGMAPQSSPGTAQPRQSPTTECWQKRGGQNSRARILSLGVGGRGSVIKRNVSNPIFPVIVASAFNIQPMHKSFWMLKGNTACVYIKKSS